jgi:hypothetical protein
MPSDEQSASAKKERDREKAAGENAMPAPPDQQADSMEQVHEEVLDLRRALLSLANDIIFLLGPDPDRPSMQRFDRGPLEGRSPPGPRMRQRALREWDRPAGPPGRTPPWFERERAMGGPSGQRRRGGPANDMEGGR